MSQMFAICFAIVPGAAPTFDRTDASSFDAAFQKVVDETLYSYDSSKGLINFGNACQGGGGGAPAGYWNSANAFTAIALKDLRSKSSPAHNLGLLKGVLEKRIQETGDFRPSNNLLNDDHLWWLWFAAEAAHLDPSEPRWLNATITGWNEVKHCVTQDCGGASIT